MSKSALIFIAFFFGGLFAALAIEVSWGIYVYQIEYFLNPPSRWWYQLIPDIRYSFTIAIIVFLSFIIRKNRYSENRLFQAPQTKWLLLDGALFALISFWAVWPEMQSLSLEKHIKLLLFMAIAYKVIDTPSKFEKMLWAFLLGNFYLGWLGHSMGRVYGTRLEGFGPADSGGDGNNTAAILISAVPILLFYAMKGKMWQRVLSLLFLPFILDTVILINSRGAFVGLVVACVYLVGIYLMSPQITAKQRVHAMGFVLIGLLIFVYLTDNTFWDRMSTIEEDRHEEMAGGGRLFLWKKTFVLMDDYPFGVGTWGYQYLSPEFLPEEITKGGRKAVHSLYFQVLAERGYIGFLIFAALLFSNFRLMRRTRGHLLGNGDFYLYFQGVAIESAYIGYLSASLFLNRLQAEVTFWFMLFIACFGNIYFFKDASTTPQERDKDEIIPDHAHQQIAS